MNIDLNDTQNFYGLALVNLIGNNGFPNIIRAIHIRKIDTMHFYLDITVKSNEVYTILVQNNINVHELCINFLHKLIRDCERPHACTKDSQETFKMYISLAQYHQQCLLLRKIEQSHADIKTTIADAITELKYAPPSSAYTAAEQRFYSNESK